MNIKPGSLTVSLFLFASAAFSQPIKTLTNKPQADFILGTVRSIQSTILKEERVLNIYLPEGYSPDSAITYPVIYLLDGSANEDFIHMAGLVQFLVMIEAMPKSIVVGVANIDRRRDFTFPTTIEKDKKDFPTTGGSSSFITFIEKELEPFIVENYKTSGERTLIGQSLGGLLTVEVLVEKPMLFDNYIVISPSLWWDDESLLARAAEAIPKLNDRKLKIFVSVGTEGSKMEGDAKKLSELLQASNNPSLQVSFLPMPNETHQTILHRSAYEGLEWMNRVRREN